MIPTCLFLLLSVLKVATLARGATNITVDDQDPRIVYSPRSSWQTMDGLDVDSGGFHMFTSDVDGYAEIKMTFISFYIISALYPTRIMANITLDGMPIGRINLQDYNPPKFNVTDNVTATHGTVPYKIVYSYPGNSSQEHVIRLSSVGDSPLVLDAFIFEVDPAPSSSSVNSPASNNRTKFIAIGLGVAIPVFLLVTILVSLLLLRRRRKSKKVIDFDPSAMGGRPATRQDVYPDDASVANGDSSGMVTSPSASNSLAVETPRLAPPTENGGDMHLQFPSNSRTKTPEADSALMEALSSERDIDVAGNSPMASTILSTSPDSSTSLIGHYSLSLPHPTVPLRPLSPVHHPSLRAQIQSRSRNSTTGAGSEGVGTHASNRHGYGSRQPPR